MSAHATRVPSFRNATLIQGAVVALGLMLWMTVDKAWILVAGLGAFVPGILRELGLVRDLDEFQRDASRRAAFHAYLVGGLATAAIVSAIHLTGGEVAYPGELLTLVLAILWMTWLFSYLLAFWGPRRTATAVLSAFGAFWLLFAVLDGASGAETPVEGVIGVLMHLLFVLPFALGAYGARRWPRATGWALVAAGLFLAVMLGKPSSQPWTTRLMTLTILAVPILASGIGLVRVEEPPAE